MPIFVVRGQDGKGEAFRRRFEAPSKTELTLFVASRSLQVTGVQELPLSRWPFSFLPFLSLLLPLLAWGVLSFGAAAAKGGLTLLREGENQKIYETLAREGVTVEGRVTALRQEPRRRGQPIPVVEYQYRDPAGSVQRGALAGRPGNASAGVHDLSLLSDTHWTEGDSLVVVVHPQTPQLHAPFQLNEEFFTRHRARLEARRRSFLFSLAGLAVCAWAVWNVALRLGTPLQHSSHPRIVEFITSGPSLVPGAASPTPEEAA